MPPFKKSGGFDNKKRFGRPQFGGDDARRPGGFSRDHGGGRDRRPASAELFSATCATCGVQCKVPFRPTGERPVFCRDCFQARGAAGAAARPDRTPFTPAPQEPMHRAHDPQILALHAKIDSIKDKLETLIQLSLHPQVKDHAPVAAPTPAPSAVVMAPKAIPISTAAAAPAPKAKSRGAKATKTAARAKKRTPKKR